MYQASTGLRKTRTLINQAQVQVQNPRWPFSRTLIPNSMLKQECPISLVSLRLRTSLLSFGALVLCYGPSANSILHYPDDEILVQKSTKVSRRIQVAPLLLPSVSSLTIIE